MSNLAVPAHVPLAYFREKKLIALISIGLIGFHQWNDGVGANGAIDIRAQFNERLNEWQITPTDSDDQSSDGARVLIAIQWKS